MNNSATLSADVFPLRMKREVEGTKAIRQLKHCIWLYFLLLIFEGALRKWILPGLATPLLIVRDPLALMILLLAVKNRLFPLNIYSFTVPLIAFTGIYTAFFLGHGNLFVAIYGARIFLFHFPMIFVMGRVFDRKDVAKMGKVILWMSLPMVVLIALQFYSPQSAFVNRGVGGVEDGFTGAMGYFRPPATFSFTNGTSLFFSLVGCYVVYFWLNPKEVNKVLLLASTAALFASIPLSISRALFFQICVTIVFAVLAVMGKRKYAVKMILAVIGGFLALAVLSKSSFFQTATLVFNNRFETANKVEGGVQEVLLERYLGRMLWAFRGEGSAPFFGYGLGLGTNVGSMLLSGTKASLRFEREWDRVIGELGLLLGLFIILLRLGFSLDISIKCLKKIRSGDLLPWMLLSFTLLLVPQGQWAQPTSLGFTTVLAGLTLASLRASHNAY